jgi:ATP-binding cassette, subfamily B (MDR/TAP), member 1
MKSALAYGIFRAIILVFFLYSSYLATYFVQVGVVNPPTNKEYLIEEILAVNVAMIIAFMQVLLIVPKVTQVAQAAKVGSTIFQVIERTPKIQVVKNKQPFKLERAITFTNVHFTYPTTPKTALQLFAGANFQIVAGTSNAIIG